MKKRLDIMMVEQGLAPSREKAKAYIMAGEVYVNGQKEDKAGSMFAETAKLEVRGRQRVRQRKSRRSTQKYTGRKYCKRKKL